MTTICHQILTDARVSLAFHGFATKIFCQAQNIMSVKGALEHTVPCWVFFLGDTNQDEPTSGPDSKGKKENSSIWKSRVSQPTAVNVFISPQYLLLSLVAF